MESIGAPHPEVRLILINGQPENFACVLHDGDEVHLYPPHQHPQVDKKQLMPYRPEAIRFVLDVHLSRLASYLRLAGFDTLYFREDPGDEKLARLAASEERILLSRDIGLLKRGIVRFGHWLRATQPRQQLREVVDYYRLQHEFRPFSRCSLCNGKVIAVDKQAVISRLPHSVRREQQRFWQCTDCKKVYWQGSHYYKVLRLFHHAGAHLTEKYPAARHPARQNEN